MINFLKKLFAKPEEYNPIQDEELRRYAVIHADRWRLKNTERKEYFDIVNEIHMRGFCSYFKKLMIIRLTPIDSLIQKPTEISLQEFKEIFKTERDVK